MWPISDSALCCQARSMAIEIGTIIAPRAIIVEMTIRAVLFILLTLPYRGSSQNGHDHAVTALLQARRLPRERKSGTHSNAPIYTRFTAGTRSRLLRRLYPMRDASGWQRRLHDLQSRQ